LDIIHRLVSQEQTKLRKDIDKISQYTRPQKITQRSITNHTRRWIKSKSTIRSNKIGILGIDSRQGLEIFLFATSSRRNLGPSQPSLSWVPGALSLRLKRFGREDDHSHLSSAEVENAWSCTSTPPTRLYGVLLS
jgi:hypothetical protein